MILNWRKFYDITDPSLGKKRTVWFLAGIMSYYRYTMVYPENMEQLKSQN